MSSLSNSQTTASLKPSSNDSLLIYNKLKYIRKKLLNIEKEEVSSFSSLTVKIYKEEIEDQKHKSEIKIPITFKHYYEDFQKNKNLINQLESGLITTSNTNSIQDEQINSSDLVNSD